MTFEPNEEMQTWAKAHFDGMGIGGIWSPEGAGLTYKKESDTAWKLIRKMEHPSVEENHKRFSALMISVGINMIEGEEVGYEPPASPEEAYAQELEHKMEIAKSWACECGEYKLMDMDLTMARPRFLETQEVLLEDGETDEVEVWAYMLECPCGKFLNVDPDDYHLMAGDQLFMRYVNKEGETLQAMTRRQMIHAAESERLGVLIGTSDPKTGEKVPPWMWGTYCMTFDGSEEE